MPPWIDPAADRYLVFLDGMKNSKHFHDDGDVPFIEDPEWKRDLQLDKDGQAGADAGQGGGTRRPA